ncbi:phasin family protein [Paraburkholderia panacisoli]|uniref:Phasin family protein n=1 Tax=Paraburkholderia panacisoli TaxID=2603818 RepID=A0A5B0H831_9BURK|nr:TIGR01841 family phasin [Paraburkholderia panacisoli]KAA1011301.1 phasin family protein [Paraburkholderia panacisoli]
MESTNPNTLFAEYIKLIKQFKLPGIDASAVLESRRKDIEALAAANTTALTGMQSLGQKQMEILSATMTQLQSLVAQHSGTQSKPAAGEAVQQALHKALADMQELAETAYRAQADSFAVISKRVAENVEELKALVQRTK